MSIYSWGANSHGQLGLNFASEMCITPQKLTNIPFTVNEINKIVGGGGHVLILLTNGKLYSCGWNSKGQLGLSNSEDQYELTEVKSGFNFIEISAGWETSAGITDCGELYLWGSNIWNEIGHVVQKTVKEPSKLVLPVNEAVSRVTFGLRHTVIFTKCNKIYLLGKCKWLQKCSHNFVSLNDNIWVMKPNLEVKDIVSGENYIVIFYADGKLVTIGDEKYIQSPGVIDLIDDTNIKVIKSGWSHSGYLNKNGDIYLWGRNNYGQLGLAKNDNFRKFLNIPKATDFCLGSQHGMALTEDGIYVWGWNEHGNCGNGTTENLYAPQKLDFFDHLTSKIIGTGAGFCYVASKNN